MNRSSLGLLPPMQAGGWMIEETTANITSAPTLTVPAVSRKPVPAITVNCQLLGCLQGLLINSNDQNSQSYSAPWSKGLDSLEEATAAYAADITMFPEGLKRGTSNATVSKLLPESKGNSNLQSSVEWSKRFTYPLLFSLQQTQVSFMKITVYTADSVKSFTSSCGKDSKKSIFGSAILDMSSFIDTDGTAQMFLLPVKAASKRKEKELIRGWLVLGLQYFANKNSNAPSVTSVEIDKKAASTWLRILSDPAIASTPLMETPNSSAEKSLRMATSRTKLLAAASNDDMVVHVALGQLELTRPVLSDLQSARDEVIFIQIRGGMNNDPLRLSTGVNTGSSTTGTMDTWTRNQIPNEDPGSDSAIAVLNRATGQLEWDAANVAVMCAVNVIFTPVLYVTLYRGKRAGNCNIDTTSCTFIGEAVLVLSKSSLSLGAPINVVSPLRDMDGTRVAILHIGAHKTAVLPSGTPVTGAINTRATSTLLLNRQMANSTASDDASIALTVCIEDGSVIDPAWRQAVEPFFELTLVPPRDGITSSDNNAWRARTGFIGRNVSTYVSSSSNKRWSNTNQQSPTDARNSDIRTSKASLLTSSRTALAECPPNPWGLVCTLLLPREGFPTGPADEMGKPIWALAVICRDASRVGCPEIASARVGLPWSLVARGRCTDQWVVLFNNLPDITNGSQPGNSSMGMDMMMRGIDGDGSASLGRIRLKILSKNADDPKGMQLATMGRSGPWTGISTFQQFQSQVTLGTVCVPMTMHALVKTAMHPGIGMSLIWLKGLMNLRSGQEIEPLNITMACATSLVMPSTSQSAYSDAYFEDTASGEDKEKVTFSELVFGRYGNSSESSDTTRTAGSAWGEDWMAGVPGLDGLCGSLPVAGGHSVLRLGISVSHQKLPYTASFSVLSGLSKGSPQGSESQSVLDIPSLDILVSYDDNALHKQSTRGSFAQELRGTVKSVPRLKLWTSFVPFVRGRLSVCCRSVRFPIEAQQMRRFPDGRAHRCALRLTMSNESFGYTAAFDIPLTVDTVVTSSSLPYSAGDNGDTNGNSNGHYNTQSFKPLGITQTQTGASDQSTKLFKNVTAAIRPAPSAPGRLRAGTLGAGFCVTLPIDTLDITTRGGSCSMLTMQITLLDLDESGTSYLIGIGGLQTSPLYHQALKSASSSAPPGPESDGSSSVNVGVSQWATSESTVYNNIQQPAAWVTLSAQFAMEGLSPPVVSALQAARQSLDVTEDDERDRGMDKSRTVRGPRESCQTQATSNTYNGSDPEELHILSDSRAVSPFGPESALKTARAVGGADKARTELGLKQAFLVADTDRSGSVSVDELIAVIKQSGIKVARSQSRGRSRPGTSSGTRTVVGMEDTIGLLLGLAGDTIDLATLKRSDQLDITSDGELEQTVKRIFSRLDLDGDGMISWWEWQASLSGALLGRHPNEKFIDPLDGLAVISQAADDALTFKAQQMGMRGPGLGLPDLWDIPYINPSDTARMPLTVSNAGAVTRLQQEVSSLRRSAVWGASSVASDNALVAAAMKKQMEAEAAAHEARQGHREESKRRVDLEASLFNLKRLNDAVKGAREDKDQTNRQLSDTLSADAAVHKNKLDSITASKKRRFKASLTIALFLRRIVIPRHRRLKEERGRAVIGRALLGVFHRKHFLKTMDLKTRATLLLQKRIRGVIGRMRLRKLKEAAIKVQRVYRGSRGRDKCQKMLINRAAIRFSKQYCAAEKLKFAMQRFVKRLKASRHKAAITIQSATRKRAAYKVLSGRKNDRAMILLRDKKAQEEAERQYNAACLIGKMARDRSAIKTAKGHRNRLLQDRIQREKDIESERNRANANSAVRMAEEKRRAEKESKAAVIIQAASRGRSGRKRHGQLKDKGIGQQQRLARYQSAAKYMRAVLPKPAVKNSTGSWVRFQKKHERVLEDVESEVNTPAVSPRDSRLVGPGSVVAPSSPRRRSIVGPSQPLISPRSTQPAAPIVTGPLLIHFRDLSYIEIGTKVEALYGSESTWFPGKIVRVLSVPLPESKSAPSSSSPRRKKVQSFEEEGVEEVMYHVRYDDGDEETCSRGKIRVPECKEKQPGVLATSQEVHAQCTSAEMTLRGRILGGPFRPQGIGVLAEGAGAGTGGGAGPEDEYDILFFLDEEKEKSVTERVKRKHIIAPHLSAVLVGELKEREAERNEEKVRQEAFAARQVVVKKPLNSPRKMEPFASPRWEALVAVSVSRGEGPDFTLIGEVTRVDKHRRIIHAQLLNATTLEYYTVELPYDHPRLLWFSYDPSDGDVGGVEEILDLDQSSIPDIEEVLDGYYVSYPVEGRTAERCGQVVSVIKEKREVVVYFQDTINGLITDITETVPYDKPNLSWYKDESRGGEPALVSWVAQPALRDATGYLVEIRSLEPDALQGDMFAGEVVAVDDKTNTILVSFDCNGEDEDDEDDVEMVPYDSLDIVWVSPPLYLQSLIKRPPLSSAIGCEVDVFNETRSCKNGPKDVIRGRIMSVREGEDTIRVRFKNGAPDEVFPYESMQISWISEAPPSFLSRSAVPRPHLPQAIGYEVEVKVREEDREGGERHAYVGEVISVNKETNSIRVRFQGSGSGDDVPDCDDITYFSTDIAWMKKSAPIASRSLVSRPPLEDAVGYIVDVKSHEEDHDHDDVYVGEVVAVDTAAGTMRVLFEGQQGEKGDEEDIEYTSLDVAWMQKKIVPPTRILSPRSPFIPGKSQSQEVLRTEDKKVTPPVTKTEINSTPDKVKNHKAPIAPSTPSPYSLPPESKSPGSLLSAVPRPDILECVGYKVQTRDLARNTVSGEISAVLLEKRAVFVLFEERKAIGPRGTTAGSMGREHYFDFDSPALAWMEAPTDCLLSQSSVPRPPLDLCVGCEVEVKSMDPGSDSNDAYPGRVISVDVAKRMMKVLFVGDNEEDADEENIPYDSKDVAWKSYKKNEKSSPHDSPIMRNQTQAKTQTEIQANAHAVIAHAANCSSITSTALAMKNGIPNAPSSTAQPSNITPITTAIKTQPDKHPITKPIKKPPPILQNMIKWDELDSREPVTIPPIESAEGYYIAVSDEDGDIRGRVVGASKRMLRIKLIDEDGEEDDEVLELQYTSPSIRWYRDRTAVRIIQGQP